MNLNPFSWWKKEETLDFNSTFAVIRLTKPAIGSFINDNFNKKISIFSSWGHYKRDFPKKEIPFTKIDLRNVRDILEIPIIEERLLTEGFEFMQGENFGEVRTVVR